MILRSFLILFCSLNLVPSPRTAFEKGLDSYEKRAEGHEGFSADPEIINRALDFFKEAYRSTPTAKTAEYILRCYYFKGNFTVPGKDDREEVFEQGKNFGDTAIIQFPESAELLYYYTITYGKWGEHIGLWSGLKEDVADHLKACFEKVIEIDPKAVDAGGHRILGVIHYKIPYIPFVVSWPSAEEAEKNLKQALAYFPDNLSNNYFYAEFLELEGRDEEAIGYLQKILESQPRETFLVEDTWSIIKARELLERIEG